MYKFILNKIYYINFYNSVLVKLININKLNKISKRFLYYIILIIFFNSHYSLQPFIIVEEQKLPDPEFPTVKFPNPEEGKSTLDLSIQVANKNSSSIILANDPDADRVACATKMKK